MQDGGSLADTWCQSCWVEGFRLGGAPAIHSFYNADTTVASWVDTLTVMYRQTGTIDWDPLRGTRSLTLLSIVLHGPFAVVERLALPTVQFALRYEPEVVFRARIIAGPMQDAIAPAVSAVLEYMRAVRDTVALVLPPRPMHSTVMSYLVDTRRGVLPDCNCQSIVNRLLCPAVPLVACFDPADLRSLVSPVP